VQQTTFAPPYLLCFMVGHSGGLESLREVPKGECLQNMYKHHIAE